MSNGLAHGAVPSSADKIAMMLVDGLRRTNDRVEEFQSALADMEIARANERREDTNRFADKIDRLGERIFEQMSANHRETQAKLAEVCDKGGKDHALFLQNDLDRRGEIVDLRHRMDRAQAHEEGRKAVHNSVLKAGAWVLENVSGKGIAAVAASLALGVGIGSIDFSPRAEAQAEPQQTIAIPAEVPVTNQQGTLTQSHVEDWPLRTN